MASGITTNANNNYHAPATCNQNSISTPANARSNAQSNAFLTLLLAKITELWPKNSHKANNYLHISKKCSTFASRFGEYPFPVAVFPLQRDNLVSNGIKAITSDFGSEDLGSIPG